MKKILLILAILLISPCVKADNLPNVQINLRDYAGIEIPAGTFVPVMNTQEISTQYCPEGYKVKFISTGDMYIADQNVIPQNTEFYGYIEKINAPVVGTNAAMKIKITKMVYKNGYEIPIRGYLYNSNNNIFGGGMSAPEKYTKMAQRQQRVHYTTLQLRGSWQRKMGEHTSIPSGSNEIIVIMNPVDITNTLTN